MNFSCDLSPSNRFFFKFDRLAGCVFLLTRRGNRSPATAMTASPPALPTRGPFGLLACFFKLRNHRMFVAGLRWSDFNWLAYLSRSTPIVITLAPPVVTTLPALFAISLAALLPNLPVISIPALALVASLLTYRLACYLAAPMPNLQRRQVAGRRSRPLKLVGVFLIFELDEVRYI
jgi:hypothetical protein